MRASGLWSSWYVLRQHFFNEPVCGLENEKILTSVSQIAEATRESIGGKFKLYDGSDIAW